MDSDLSLFGIILCIASYFSCCIIFPNHLYLQNTYLRGGSDLFFLFTLFAFHLLVLIALSSNLFNDLKSERSRKYAYFFQCIANVRIAEFKVARF